MTHERLIFDDEFDDEFDAKNIQTTSSSFHPSTENHLQYRYHRQFLFTRILQRFTLSNIENDLLAPNQSHQLVLQFKETCFNLLFFFEKHLYQLS
jgi:hypothetical protein